MVTRAKDGDPQALETLRARHCSRRWSGSRAFLRDPEDARDAAQEALAKVCVRLKQFRGESQFSTWLHRLVVNTCRDAAERRWARVHEPLDDLALRTATPRTRAPRAALRARALSSPPLPAGAGRVPEGRARLLVRGDRRRSGMPVGTAKCYAHRARKRLASDSRSNVA